MFVPFLYELRARRVPVGAQEAVALARALERDLHESSLDGFYHVARALLIHSEAHLDAFDEAFLAHFKGIESLRAAVKDELFDWLREAVRLEREAEGLPDLPPEELEKMFEELLREQDERHDGGSKWIGTGGNSPFGHSGHARQGYRIGGKGGHRRAIKVADARAYRGYRSDLTLDVRQLQVALRKLRAFGREGDPELDLEGTIDATAKNAGELEVVLRPPRRPNTRVILLMDVGGSMDPYAHLVSRLFSAASKATHFKELRCYYFHNCVYGHLYTTESFMERVRLHEVLAECGRHYKLIVVGDALMAPYELLMRGGALDLGAHAETEGIAWLRLLAEHFDRVAWLNPEPPRAWPGTTIEVISQVFPMFQLTLEGLGEAVAHLTRGKGKRAG
ncbi:MAG: VWA domain-containing protein [Planctomycetota bacterium]